MTNQEAAQAAIDEAGGDVSVAALAVYNGPKTLALYVLAVGLEHLKARKRATNRREIRREIKPEFKRGKTYGSVEFTPRSKKLLFESTQRLFGKDGWNIGDLNLGGFTREGLLELAARERASAKGHIRNAQFYEALADPMKPGQLVKEYWKPEKANEIKNKIWRETETKQPALID
jgi:hypothetical protein